MTGEQPAEVTDEIYNGLDELYRGYLENPDPIGEDIERLAPHIEEQPDGYNSLRWPDWERSKDQPYPPQLQLAAATGALIVHAGYGTGNAAEVWRTHSTPIGLGVFHSSTLSMILSPLASRIQGGGKVVGLHIAANLSDAKAQPALTDHILRKSELKLVFGEQTIETLEQRDGQEAADNERLLKVGLGSTRDVLQHLDSDSITSTARTVISKLLERDLGIQVDPSKLPYVTAYGYAALVHRTNAVQAYLQNGGDLAARMYLEDFVESVHALERTFEYPTKLADVLDARCFSLFDQANRLVRGRTDRVVVALDDAETPGIGREKGDMPDLPEVDYGTGDKPKTGGSTVSAEDAPAGAEAQAATATKECPPPVDFGFPPGTPPDVILRESVKRALAAYKECVEASEEERRLAAEKLAAEQAERERMLEEAYAQNEEWDEARAAIAEKLKGVYKLAPHFHPGEVDYYRRSQHWYLGMLGNLVPTSAVGHLEEFLAKLRHQDVFADENPTAPQVWTRVWAALSMRRFASDVSSQETQALRTNRAAVRQQVLAYLLRRLPMLKMLRIDQYDRLHNHGITPEDLKKYGFTREGLQAPPAPEYTMLADIVNFNADSVMPVPRLRPDKTSQTHLQHVEGALRTEAERTLGIRTGGDKRLVPFVIECRVLQVHNFESLPQEMQDTLVRRVYGIFKRVAPGQIPDQAFEARILHTLVMERGEQLGLKG